MRFYTSVFLNSLSVCALAAHCSSHWQCGIVHGGGLKDFFLLKKIFFIEFNEKKIHLKMPAYEKNFISWHHFVNLIKVEACNT